MKSADESQQLKPSWAWTSIFGAILFADQYEVPGKLLDLYLRGHLPVRQTFLAGRDALWPVASLAMFALSVGTSIYAVCLLYRIAKGAKVTMDFRKRCIAGFYATYFIAYSALSFVFAQRA